MENLNWSGPAIFGVRFPEHKLYPYFLCTNSFSPLEGLPLEE